MTREELAALVQGSEEWKAARCGSLGASRISDVVARTKSGWGASRANIMAELIAERLTGTPAESYVNAAMQWGSDTEPEARTAYEFRQNCDVAQIGLVPHPTIKGTHASPDGLVGKDGMLEVKCPGTATHLNTLLGTPIADKYIKQVQWQMACCERAWVDWASYDPRLPETMRLFVQRIPRDGLMIKGLEKDVREFLDELNEKLARLRERYAAPVNVLMAG